MTNDPHHSLLTALQTPSLYDHPVSRFKVVETHISWVLLTGDFAYKIKKPVNLGFLDFSTLAKRHHFCHEELRLNQRFAPDLYLDVIAITGTVQHPEFHGAGPVIEYAVKMRQFSQQNLFLQMLENNRLKPDHLEILSHTLAAFHEHCSSAKSESLHGEPESVQLPVAESFQTIRDLTGTQFDLELKHLEDWSEEECKRKVAIFRIRKDQGFIKHCHGDLHLNNIIFDNNQAIPFDGIEFNENLYWIDVISDLAFLVMDLDDHHRPDLGFRFLNAWLEQTGDYFGLLVLRYYLLYRAIVRAKINSIQLTQSQSDKDRSNALAEFKNYLTLAQSYTLPPAPKLIICHGLSGSGKTTVSTQLMDRLPAIRIRSDIERKRIHHLKPGDKSGSGINDGIYTPDASTVTYKHLKELATIVIKSGFSAVIDAAFLKRDQRKPFRKLATDLGIPFLILHCKTDTAILKQRIINREKEQTDASEANQSVLEKQLKDYQQLSEEEQKYIITIDTSRVIDIEPVLQSINYE